MNLSLKVIVESGFLQDCIHDAIKLARKLELASVVFDFNEHEIICYPLGTALRSKDGAILEFWNGTEWVKVKHETK